MNRESHKGLLQSPLRRVVQAPQKLAIQAKQLEGLFSLLKCLQTWGERWANLDVFPKSTGFRATSSVPWGPGDTIPWRGPITRRVILSAKTKDLYIYIDSNTNITQFIHTYYMICMYLHTFTVYVLENICCKGDGFPTFWSFSLFRW